MSTASIRIKASVLCALVTVIFVPAARSAEKEQAREILDAAGVTGGLIVHVGSGDGRLTAALAPNETSIVHGLEADAKNVAQARVHIRSLGLYGRVSVETWAGSRLPHADNLVNLLVSADPDAISKGEIMRVLAPRGVAYLKSGDTWTKTSKPRPNDIDEWTHYLHDASNNAVAHDAVVGPPGRLQWNAGPRHTRSHEHIPGIYALVSSGGRIFYIADEGPIASIRGPARWHLVARDAFNGVPLWKKPLASWFPHIVNWGQTPRQLQRKLVAVGDRVYVTLGLHAPLRALDAASGETLRVYDQTEGAEEIVWHEGTLLLAVRNVTEARTSELAKWAELLERTGSPLYKRESAEPFVKRLRATESKGGITILALDADSGRVEWKKSGAEAAGLRTYSLCAAGERVFYQKGKEIVCLDLESGRRLWSALSAALRLVSGESVFSAGGKTVTALSAETGETRWTRDSSVTDVRDVFLAGGSLWIGGFKPFPKKRGPAWGPYFATQRDPATGEMLMHVEPENPGHHHRCYSNKATDRYILGGRRGTEFIDLATGEVLWHSWARGVCRYGVMPANGLLYAPPHACGCYVAAKLTGFSALAARREESREARVESPESRDEGRGDEGPRIERGPAYDSQPSRPSSLTPRRSDWPTYRHDAGRSGSTTSPVSAKLSERWRAEIGPRLTSPTISEGKVFVASVDEHRISAVDADSGQAAWQFTGGARVDSPPTVYQGRAIFGCRDGYVYSVRASDGALVWRLRAARHERRVAVYGQLESVSPVPGSVLVDDGVLYLTAGRSSYLDGGIDLFRLQPETGETLSRTPIYSPDPETGKQPAQFAPASMPGSREDILSADGGYVYLQDAMFDKQGVRVPRKSPHLFALTGFLDDSWPHRSYWIFGGECSIATGCSGRDRNLVFGRLLVFNGATVFGYGRVNVHWSNQLQDGDYRLFAVKRGEGTAEWAKPVAIRVRAMVLADKVLFLAGPPAGSGDREDRPESPAALVVAVSTSDGSELARYPLDSPPVFDGMAAAGGRLYLSLENGRLVCMDGK